jgi:hypothetical protein
MTPSTRYVVDADVFITAKNSYYAFDICPGFWKGLIRRHLDGRVLSIDRVRSELLQGRETEDLVQWVKRDPPASFFHGVDEGSIASKYTEIMVWAQRSTRFVDAARAKFATGADGWLVAFAAVQGAIVVTNEQPAPDSKRDIKLPDVCQQFGVTYCNAFSMLRDLKAHFEWEDP